MAKRKKKQSRRSSPSPVADDSPLSEDKPVSKEIVAEATKEDVDGAGPRTRKRVLLTLLLFLALAAAAFAAHGLCLKNPFYLDDQIHILKNSRLHSGDWWGNGQRVVPYILWIRIHTTWGFNPVAFFALNLSIHILTVFATYFAAREFAHIEQVKQYLADTPIARSFPFFAALLLAVHTLCSEVINYASQTSIELVTLFTMIATAAMFRWLTTARWWWLMTVLLASGLAALSKEVGIWHTTVSFAFVVVIFRKSLPIFNRMRSPRRGQLIIASASFLALCYYFLHRWNLSYRIGRIFTDPEMGWHWLTQSRIFWEYIWRMFLPIHLCSDHWVPVTRSTGDVVAWIGAAGILALVVGTIVLFWRQRIYGLLLAFTLLPLLFRFAYHNQEPFVEYRVYPSMPWFCMLAVLFAGGFLLKRMRPRHFAIGTTVVSLLLTGMSAKRSSTWNSPYTLVENIEKQYPLHLRSQSYIQSIDFSAKNYQAVIDRQIRVRMTTRETFKYNEENKHRKYLIQQSVIFFMYCEQFNAYALIELNRPQDAITRLTEVITAVSNMSKSDRGRPFAFLYRVRGKAHAALGEFGPAAADYRRALERNPKDLETPQLIRRLPPQFRSAAVPQPE